jgi:hypothetical protein
MMSSLVRVSCLFESRKVGASPVDFRCKIECVAPADSGLVALLQYIPCIRVKSKSKERQGSTLAIEEEIKSYLTTDMQSEVLLTSQFTSRQEWGLLKSNNMLPITTTTSRKSNLIAR